MLKETRIRDLPTFSAPDKDPFKLIFKRETKEGQQKVLLGRKYQTEPRGT